MNNNSNCHNVKTIAILITFFIIILLPFLFVIISLVLDPNRNTMIKISESLITFFIIWAVIINIIVAVLTILNNWQIKRKFNKRITFNQHALEKKKIIFDKYFKNKYGSNIHNLTNYSIKSDNNVPLNKLMNMYTEKEVDKRDGH